MDDKTKRQQLWRHRWILADGDGDEATDPVSGMVYSIDAAFQVLTNRLGYVPGKEIPVQVKRQLDNVTEALSNLISGLQVQRARVMKSTVTEIYSPPLDQVMSHVGLLVVAINELDRTVSSSKAIL